MPDPLVSANPFTYLMVICYGGLFGSFLNVVICRLPLERSVVRPGSACGVCGTPLEWWQNIPVLSYLLLGGRCHTCSCRISARYPFVEALTAGGAALLLAHHGGLGYPFFYHFAFFCLLVVVFFMDLDHWIILDQITLPGMAAGLLGSLWMPPYSDPLGPLGDPLGLAVPTGAWGNLLAGVGGVALGWLLFRVVQLLGTLMAGQEAMGGGDVKLAMMMGAFLGWKMAFVAFLLSFFLGALVALPMMLLAGRGGKDPVPFGTFMAVAGMVAALWGEPMLGFLVSWPYRLPRLP